MILYNNLSQMFRRNERRLTIPSPKESPCYDDGKDETVSRVEFPLKQEIVVLKHKLEKLSLKYNEAVEDRKKYIEQMTLSADQFRESCDENKFMSETISKLNEENMQLRQYISNINIKSKKPKGISNKLKQAVDDLKDEINLFHDSFESQSKVVEKCLESLEINLDVGNKLRDLIEYYLDASKQTECQIKRLNANVNELCSDPCTFQGRIVMKKDSSFSESSSKNMPSLFDELNTANDKPSTIINDSHVLDKLNHLETVLEEIKDTSQNIQTGKDSPKNIYYGKYSNNPIRRIKPTRSIRNAMFANYMNLLHI
ncbi:unnamed protein product [Blepharisma stoltei]|uniref:Uncharacterized protein n=1 Tax=Blepharisma stoltei TaxID=1481888 RepID=A0AAU9IMN7_9CILI|nr:unnamed protein product [Blepharisma stoltei]